MDNNRKLAESIKGFGKNRDKAKVQREKAKSKMGLAIPWLVFGFAQLVLVFGEFRVFDYVRAITNNVVLAIGTLLATGAGADIWFMGWKYSLANTLQKTIAIIMMSLNLIAATYIGFGDFFVDANGVSFGANTQTVFILLTIVLTLDLVAGITYYLVDPQVVEQRRAAKIEVELQQREQNRKLMENLLLSASASLEMFANLTDKYGSDAVKAMAALLGDGEGEDDELLERMPQNFQSKNKGNNSSNKQFAPRDNPYDERKAINPYDMKPPHNNGNGAAKNRPQQRDTLFSGQISPAAIINPPQDEDFLSEHNFDIEPKKLEG